MRVHVLQHVQFEDEGSLAKEFEKRSWPVTRSRLFSEDSLPDLEKFDLLVIMGGPMSVHDTIEYPWLIPEKEFVRTALAAEKKMLGICLGAQLLAEALGGDVRPNTHKEIGWFPVQLREGARASKHFAAFPNSFPAFHWHGETFSLPQGCLHAASSEGCASQAFVFSENVVGLQFHLETTPQSMERLIQHCAQEADAGKFVQQPDVMRQRAEFKEIEQLMQKLLAGFESEAG